MALAFDRRHKQVHCRRILVVAWRRQACRWALDLMVRIKRMSTAGRHRVRAIIGGVAWLGEAEHPGGRPRSLECAALPLLPCEATIESALHASPNAGRGSDANARFSCRFDLVAVASPDPTRPPATPTELDRSCSRKQREVTVCRRLANGQSACRQAGCAETT
jgi:hypothetical protein